MTVAKALEFIFHNNEETQISLFIYRIELTLLDLKDVFLVPQYIPSLHLV